jgi:hypothetical protein
MQITIKVLSAPRACLKGKLAFMFMPEPNLSTETCQNRNKRRSLLLTIASNRLVVEKVPTI